ncbi:helix-turn-helix domain-containing protein [Sulfitobacter sp. M57]|uniref:helix-turn-helix transcriptional regulator n=1 Tax=unclassified Sulfitobacter TaxID=196795 RepID=UPI0023E2F13D|nr:MULTISPECIES: helix-turn-helix transcriptional regulator [unclassified Sulfitobacter]MDF3413409.1 helix-turn-helix domain-containing protein [Sulfitobacter sp. KE5]MDF3421311.1 helix-turn-helix domain-containing protein [Sulfitobacter sp. KE43]MDF3431956.1 helix-turn-helix domain-containing protein [Sulfitobacter sp. KE42]MDF3457596.1 helix-turn-helix domain-containing protein [Sulfitobacter sp. S74]MDF3461498.1 helix-turn-helix domain-containing protein [Sulfitobacter sp. Ks18]
MAREALTGSRIRERRIMAGIKQADLARLAGISPSYLNLIEHNRRRIGGKLLLNIAGALGVEAQALTDGAEAALIATLRDAADAAGMSGDEVTRADEFAGRFPGWADVLAGTAKRAAALEQTVEALSDRLAHDPHLAASMHELLSTAAAIRSTAAILAENETLEPEWRNRFHANIDEDSRRLSDSTEAIVAYLDADADTADAASSPQEEVESYLSAQDFSFAALEADHVAPHLIDQMVQSAPQLRSQGAKFIAGLVLRQVTEDAALLKLSTLRAAVTSLGTDPLALASHLNCPMPCLLRRMAALPELGAGLVVCDRSGTVIFRKSIEGFTVPRHGACCPLWPLFSALGQPGSVIRSHVTQSGRADAPFVGYAAAGAIATQGYNAAPLMQAVMLLLPAGAGTGDAVAVGSTCRVCPQEPCRARREPSVISAGV